MINSHILSLFFVIFTGCAQEPAVVGLYNPADCAQAKPNITPDGGEGARKPEANVSIAQKVPDKRPNGGAGTVDLNTATAKELQTLPGVGPALAERIIGYRTKRTFKKISDIRRVKGIGPAKFQKMKSQLSIR